jgi:cyclopropane-fatty-acyl-phospholipid synthase
MLTNEAVEPARSTTFSQKLLFKALEGLRHGEIEVCDHTHGGVYRFGEPGGPTIHVDVYDPVFYRRLVLGGTVGAGEAYADGDWAVDDLPLLIELFSVNQDVTGNLDRAWMRWAKQIAARVDHRLRANTREGSRKNIAAHYDLSNEFFSLFLDERMMYSSALYEDDCTTLDAASERKLKRLCEMLDLRPGDHVLEIGTGWGGFAIYAAQHYDVHVTTTTISKAQHDEAVARIAAAGLTERITVRLDDYRDLTGVYDKLISIEMVEAVGDEFLDGYFRDCDRLLAPGGRFVMQAITIQDQRYDAALRYVDFIKKHIFPGSFIPCINRLTAAAANTESLRLTHMRDIGLDYAKTLNDWSDRFSRASATLDELGFDERFQRLWRFYFAYCEGGFRARAISNAQLVFAKAPAGMSS